MAKTILLAVLVLAVCLVLMSVTILLRRNGRFPNTHVSGNKALRDKGITCVQSQDFEVRHKKHPNK